ncbi:MAG TPA: C-terminal binding protein [Candidatus Dormibacteraeota bacterium]|nr:C-terminal binding protein [Candidatus Dormibacteraeota bacterium]
MSSMRVMVDAPPFPLDLVGTILDPTGALVDARPRPWSGGDIVGLLVWNPVSAVDLEQLPSLRVIATCSVGFDHIDAEAAAKRGVWVCNVPDYCIEVMADSTLALELALLRGVVALDRTVRAGIWDDHAAGPLPRLSETRLGVIGFGRIGRAVAARALALGMEVWATDPLVAEREMAAAGVKPATIDGLLRSCLAVTLHMPLTKETLGMIGERELALMPTGAFLVNTARAGLVDSAALMAALESGHLGGAAFDVLDVEPPTSEHPAPVHPRLIVTPHAAWYSPRSEEEVYRRAALAVRAVLEGGEPKGAVTRPLVR